MTNRKLIVLGVIAAGLVNSANTASAQWNPVKQVTDAAKRAEKSVRKEAGNAAKSFKRAHQLNYNVHVRNPTGSFIAHVFNGKLQVPLPPHRINSWRGSMYGNPTISFDNGHGQTVRYTLNRYSTYEFRWVGRTLRLYRV